MDDESVARTLASVQERVNVDLVTQSLSARMSLASSSIAPRRSCCDLSGVIDWIGSISMIWWPLMFVYFVGLYAGRWAPI